MSVAAPAKPSRVTMRRERESVSCYSELFAILAAKWAMNDMFSG